MRRPIPLLITSLLWFTFVVSCDGGDREAGTGADPGAASGDVCRDPAVRDVVGRFGRALRDVSLLAPDSVVSREMEAAYGPLVMPELLTAWLARPASAPGREVSSPWPDHIEVDAVEAAGAGGCVVRGRVVYASSADPDAADARQPVTITLSRNGGWRVAAYQETTGGGAQAPAPAPDVPGGEEAPGGPADAAAAAAVIRDYYAAIEAGAFERAYGLWADDGAASEQSLDAFRAGFAETADVRVDIGEPDRIEGAAGSRYIEIPATVHATTTDGVAQRFEGTYTLRRSVVDGATAAQRRWHIHAADLREVGG